ncbi:TPA: hypothetical protein ACKE3U_003767 [Klebsiella aerogenes]
MIDHLLVSFILLCVFYTASRLVGWLVDVLLSKFIASDKSLECTVSNLISQTSLRWGGIENDKSYTFKTKGYVVSLKKSNNKDK